MLQCCESSLRVSLFSTAQTHNLYSQDHVRMWLFNSPSILLRWDCFTILFSLLSQLYGSTTVVMATHGLHWKWQSLTPCQRHTSKPIEKIFGMIDYVIDLNNLAKFGSGKIFPDGGTHTQHIRVRPFFLFIFFIYFFNFLRSLMRVQPKPLNRFWRAIRHSTPFGESQTLF